jgi:DNA-binding response OmpR family regulator
VAEGTVAIVDDDTSLLKTLERILDLEGYEVRTATNAESGLKLVRRIRPHVIILDIAMPGMGGLGFLKEISGEGGKPEFPIIVLTARPNLGDFFADLDVDGFMEKPCGSDALLDEVARVIAAHVGEKEGGAAKRAAKPGGKLKALLAEDDVSARVRLQRAMAEAGFEVDTVQDGSEVVERVLTGSPSVIVLKQILTGMNGDKVASILAELPKTKDVPVVMYQEDAAPGTATRMTSKFSNVVKYVDSSESQTLIKAVKSAAKA